MIGEISPLARRRFLAERARQSEEVAVIPTQ
jgi:hypothetical protein